MKISLIPVIELEPASYKNESRISPAGLNSESTNELSNYYKNSYLDSGLENIKPIEPLSWFFELEKLSSKNLKIILKTIIDESIENHDSIEDILNDLNEYTPFISGGYTICINGQIESRPGCCSGLEAIYEWCNVFNENNGFIDNGHDSNSISINTNESELEIGVNIDDKLFLVDRNTLKKEVIKAKKVIDQFIIKSGDLISEIYNIQNGDKFGKSMIYKYGELEIK